MPGHDAADLILAADAAAPSGGFDMMGIVLMVVAMGAIMYFMVFRPQQREKQARETLMNSLSKGDEVVTTGGIHGRVVSVEDAIVRIDIGGKAIVSVDKEAIARKPGAEPAADAGDKKKG